MIKPHILFLTEGEDIPSTRFAVSSFIPYLEEHGIHCSVSHRRPQKYSSIKLPYLNYKICRILIYCLFVYPFSLSLRLLDIWKSRQYDITFVQRDLDEHHTSAWLERLFKRYSKCFIFYFDDAIWISRNYFGRSLEQKIQEIIRMADLVFVSHKYLADYAHQFNSSVMIFPMSIDTQLYSTKPPTTHISSEEKEKGMKGSQVKSYQREEKVTLGWSGGPWNYPEILELVKILDEIKKETGIEILIQSGEPPPLEIQEIGVIYIPWRKDMEVKIIQRMDIAICPLRDSPWTRGKFSIKLLQFMACGIPVVCSDVSVNRQIIVDGLVGFVVKTQEEWRSRILSLIHDKERREQMGRAARQRAVNCYSLEKAGIWLADFFLSLTKEA
jgi:glycosyltransferase involved in cell wall biosynthesis